jgi:hypothetical protein
MRLVDDYTQPKPNIHEIMLASAYMGQDLLNPPTVEGWHTGKEWIDSGALVERINFASNQVGNLSKPGVRRIVERLEALGPVLTTDQLVNGCLDLAGPVVVSDNRREDLVTFVNRDGAVRCGTPAEKAEFARRVAGLLQLVVSSREFQFA